MMKKLTLPSKIIKNELTKFEKEAVASVASSQNISLNAAKRILTNDERFLEILSVKDKQARLEMMDNVLPKIVEAIETKTKNGSMEQAKAAMTAWGIGKDKVMGQDKYSQPVNIAGKNVQVNLKWKPKWLKK